MPTRSVPTASATTTNEFAFALYSLLRRTPGNLFFSPLSLRVALGMALAGARGDTATEMSTALRFSASDDSSHADLAEAIRRLQAEGEKCEIAVANALWGQAGAPVEANFLELIGRHYGGAMNVVDFVRHAEEIRLAINRWVEEKTRQRIAGLIPPGGVHDLTRLVLVNAVYFKGTWLSPFKPDATKQQPFVLPNGSIVDVPLMHRQVHVHYLQGRGYQAVDLPYEGGAVSMLVLLPDDPDGLPSLEERVSGRMLDDCVSQTRACDVNLFLPRFRFTWGTVDLRTQSIELGVRLAFDCSRADFSGINGYPPGHREALFISNLYHKAFLDVNEAGTEAAAASALMMVARGMGGRPPEIPMFRADHPFLFAIRVRRTGALLFLGRVEDPTAAG
jgi:serpin B